MYKNNHKFKGSSNNRSGGKQVVGFQKRNSQSGFRSRPKRNIKILDERLFIKKAASDAVLPEIEVVKTAFSDFSITEKLKRNIADHGYIHPTQIQEKTIPHILAGRDVIGVANTGTGKTASFLIPLVNKASENRAERVLIVTPTRELAMQIIDELTVFTRGMDLNAVLCIGGASMFRQEKKLVHNPHFVIGTPGRLKDLVQRKKLNLQLFRNVVLDEVDRMVDIGFIHDVKFFISQLPVKRQSLFFSATVSAKVKEILHSFVTDAVTVSVVKQETSENVEQNIIRVRSDEKLDKLHDLLVQDGFNKVLVFGRTKWGVEKLSNALENRGFKTGAIHGNKSQGQRQRALAQFKQNQIQVLLATDVASRGIDIDDVTHVINYDAPESYDDYVHRIGRTGRAGRRGVALTFVE